MSLKKTATIEEPHATFVNTAAGWTWKILKVYRKAANDKGDAYARWFLAAKSPHTFGEYEMGDTYITEVTGHATLQSATPEFHEYWKEYTS